MRTPLWIVVSLAGVFAATSVVGARSLTLEERAAAMGAVQEVLRELTLRPEQNPGAAPVFDGAYPQDAMRAQAEDALLKSEALGRFWGRPVTAAQLQAEIDRLVRDAKRPEDLRRYFAVLGNDPVLIAECLARPLLADRLARSLYARDERVHGALRRRIESRLADRDAAADLAALGDVYREAELRAGSRDELTDDAWQRQIVELAEAYGIEARGDDPAVTLAGLPVATISPVLERDDSFVVRLIRRKSRESLRVATAVWEKEPFDAWWARTRSEFGPADVLALETPDAAYSIPAAGGPVIAAPVSSGEFESIAAPARFAPPEQAITQAVPASVPENDSGNIEMPYISEVPSGLTFPTTTPVDSEIFLGAQGVGFGYCLGGPRVGLSCRIDAECPQSTCERTRDNTFCLSYNMTCSGSRSNTKEYAFNDVFEANFDHAPAAGRQSFVERNWNYLTADGTFFRPFAFVLEVDANSTCVGGTNPGAYCTLLDEAGTCKGGGACTGAAPTGAARWTFSPNNRNGNSSLLLAWPATAVNARVGTDDYRSSGFSSWMRTSDSDTAGATNGAGFTTYLDHPNDRRGPWFNGLDSTIDFNTTSAGGTVGRVHAGFFDARISGSTPSRVIGTLTGVRSEVNLVSTGNPQVVPQSYGLSVQLNPSGSNITAESHAGILIDTPSPPGSGTRITTQHGLWIADQQLVRSGGEGSAILVSAQTASNGWEGNIRMDGGNWSSGHLQLNDGHLWRDATRGVIRFNNAGAPGSETDGRAVVTGTASNSHGIVFWGVSTSIDANFDSGNEVCAASGSGLTCVDTANITGTASIACNQAHTTSKWLAFCK